MLGMKGDALKGHLDLLILSVLEEGPLHGYAVIERLRERSNSAFDLPEGTVYPVLHRLATAGLLDSEWAEVSGRRRRTYRLTEKGRQALPHMKANFSDFVAAMNAVMRGARLWPNPI